MLCIHLHCQRAWTQWYNAHLRARYTDRQTHSAPLTNAVGVAIYATKQELSTQHSSWKHQNVDEIVRVSRGPREFAYI